MKLKPTHAPIIAIAAIVLIASDASAYYAPPLGRWITRDPISYEGSRWNLYEYVGGKPNQLTDPFGLAHTPQLPFLPIEDEEVGCCYKGAASIKDLQFCMCLEWMRDEQDRPTDWLDALPNCPCSIGNPPRNPDPYFWEEPGAPVCCHPGAANCIRSKENLFGRGQQCCYDSGGNLITGGGGAGTPDRSAPPGQGHYLEDVKPFNVCPLEYYHEFRPPNNGNNCPENKG
jgi:hypothetical protein